MLANVIGNCVVTNVTYSDNKYHAVTWTFYLESSMYLRRCQWLHQIVVMCHIARWFRSGAVLKFDQFYHSNFFLKPTLDLFPRNCTYAKVIDLRIMVLWSVGFIANWLRIPPTKLACVRYWIWIEYFTIMKSLFPVSFYTQPLRFGSSNHSTLKMLCAPGTGLFGLANLVWPFRSGPFRSRNISVWPFRSQDISFTTFLYTNNFLHSFIEMINYWQGKCHSSWCYTNSLWGVMIAIKSEL